MKCFNHINMDAVGQCVDCNKGLCSDCVELYSPPLCRDCMLKRTSATKSELVKSCILSIIFCIAGFIVVLLGEHNFLMAIAAGYVWGGIPWGWQALNRITPSVFLFLPLIGWVIYFIIKLILSCWVGIVVTPFKIYRLLSEYRNVRSLEASA